MHPPSKRLPRGINDARRSSLVHEITSAPTKGQPRVTTEPGPDGLYRDCVIREPHNDLLGRPIYVALNADGNELDRSVAVGWEQTEKVLARLWDVVYRARERHLHLA